MNKNHIALACMLTAFVLLVLPVEVKAAGPITLRYKHHLYTINPDSYSSWYGQEEYWTFFGTEVHPKPQWRVDGDKIPELPEGVEKKTRAAWNRSAVAETIRQRVASRLNREAGSVVISRNGSGTIMFDGVGLLGLKVDVDKTANLVIEAVENNVADVLIVLDEIQPEIDVTDPVLRKNGIKEVVTVGQSDFTGSTWTRIHNVQTGLSKFNGHLIPKGSVFSFNEKLGRVDGTTGYKRELVILGDKTVPEYGGGLCQVSTTAYRGAWEYGFPIESRRNHSYAVDYYGPQGTDATIYPGVQDMKFTNNSPGDLLIQTHIDVDNKQAYFIYYGTIDDRSAEIIGPYVWARVGIPPPRTEYTSDLAPGERKKLGSAVPGMKSAWFRVIQEPKNPEPTIEGYYSTYQARPLYYQIGISAADQTTDEPVAPTWFGESVSTTIESTEVNPIIQSQSTFRPNPRNLRR